MAQYMLILRGGNDEVRDYTPEQQQQLLQQYYDWSAHLRSENRMRSGDALKDDGRIVKPSNGGTPTDGPYVETKEHIGGYYLIDAASYDEAAEVSKGCPILTHNGHVEIREIMELP